MKPSDIGTDFMEELWVEAQVPLEAFKKDAVKMEGYHEQMVRDAFMAGLISAVIIIAKREEKA